MRQLPVVAVAACALWLTTGAFTHAAPPAEAFVSEAVSAPSSSSSCSTSAATTGPIRAQVDLLDDPWRAAAAADGLSTFAMSALTDDDPVTTHPTTISFAGSAITADVSLRNVSASSLPWAGGASGDPSTGTLATVNSNGPRITALGSDALQQCAPAPLSLAGTPTWSEVAGAGSSINGVLFEFSVPVRAWGAWFGDLETRPGTPGWIKAFAADGSVLFEGDIPADAGDAPFSDAECGGPSSSDPLACGNQQTRWVGFVSSPARPVAAVLVTVGDDDSCTQGTGNQCNGGSEHLSWIGATIATDAADDPNPTTTTTTTTTLPPTTTTTTIDTATTTPQVTTTVAPATTAVAVTSTVPQSSAVTTVPQASSTSTSIAPASTDPTPTTVPVPDQLLPATGGEPAHSLMLGVAAVFAGVGAVAVSRRAT